MIKNHITPILNELESIKFACRDADQDQGALNCILKKLEEITKSLNQTKPTEPKKMNNENKNENAKILALASSLGCEPEELTESKWGHYSLTSFEYGSREYAIGTGAEADAACLEYIKDSVWAFRAEFILEECGLPYQLAPAIQAYQNEECEGANDALLSLIEKTCGLESFAESAISADGRGHFLSSYDGEENEEGDFFIYRTN